MVPNADNTKLSSKYQHYPLPSNLIHNNHNKSDYCWLSYSQLRYSTTSKQTQQYIAVISMLFQRMTPQLYICLLSMLSWLQVDVVVNYHKQPSTTHHTPLHTCISATYIIRVHTINYWSLILLAIKDTDMSRKVQCNFAK